MLSWLGFYDSREEINTKVGEIYSGGQPTSVVQTVTMALGSLPTEVNSILHGKSFSSSSVCGFGIIETADGVGITSAKQLITSKVSRIQTPYVRKTF